MTAPVQKKKNPMDLNFFKRFKKQVPVTNVIEEEIVVAPRPTQSSGQTVKPEDVPQSTPKKDSTQGSRTQPSSSDNVLSPTRPLPIGTPRKSSQYSHVEGPGDETINTSSPLLSQTRTLKAVEIPSPRVSPPLPKEPEVSVPRTTFASFSSISTLSSVPMSSSSSSRRIVKNGIKAVTNSDSGSADSDSDELADPMQFLARKRRKLTPPGQDAAHAIQITDSAETVRQSNRLSNMGRQGYSGIKACLPPSPPRNVYKHSLMKLVKQTQTEEKTASRMREAEAAFEEARRKREERMKEEEDMASGLKAAVAEDSDEGDRMMLAMQRTEALQEDEKFYLFRTGVQMTREEFPSLRDPGGGGFSKPWMRVLRNVESRRHAFLSGFVADVAATGPLPSLLASWIENQLFFETRTDLLEAYVEVLQNHISQTPTGKSEIPGLGYYYKTLGDLEKTDHRDRATIPAGPPRGLAQVLQVLVQLCASQLTFSASTASLVVDLMLASIDENIKRSADLVSTIQEALDSMLACIPDDQFETACKGVHKSFFERDYLSKQRRCQIISAMPATSGRTQHLRRLLALHLLAGFYREEQYHHNLQSSIWVEVIKTELGRGSEFNISATTNYKMFDAMIAILDIAIDAGFPDTTAKPIPVKPKVHFSKTSGTPSAEAIFNAQIDELTHELQLVSSQIKGSGTSHLRRTEAKSSLDRLILRLEHGVRTRPKPRKGVFGDATGAQRDFLSSFLKSAIAPQDDEDGVSIVAPELLNDRELSNGQDSPDEASAVSGAESTSS